MKKVISKIMFPFQRRAEGSCYRCHIYRIHVKVANGGVKCLWRLISVSISISYVSISVCWSKHEQGTSLSYQTQFKARLLAKMEMKCQWKYSASGDGLANKNKTLYVLRVGSNKRVRHLQCSVVWHSAICRLFICTPNDLCFHSFNFVHQKLIIVDIIWRQRMTVFK